MNIAVITGTSSGLGVKFLEAVLKRYPDVEKLTARALVKAEKGDAVYTPEAFYKCYRIAAKLIPSAWMVRIVGKAY